MLRIILVLAALLAGCMGGEDATGPGGGGVFADVRHRQAHVIVQTQEFVHALLELAQCPGWEVHCRLGRLSLEKGNHSGHHGHDSNRYRDFGVVHYFTNSAHQVREAGSIAPVVTFPRRTVAMSVPA